MKPKLPSSLLKAILLTGVVTTTVAAVTMTVYTDTAEEPEINFIDSNVYTNAQDVTRESPLSARAVSGNVLTVDDTAAIYVTSDGYTANGATEYREIGKKNFTYNLSTNGSYSSNAKWITLNGMSFWYGEGNATATGSSGGNGQNQWREYAYNQNSTAARLEHIILPEGKQLYIGGEAYKGTIEITTSATAGG